MRRNIIFIAVTVFVATSLSYVILNDYWIHRYDELISTQAKVYRLDEKLVWSVIYEETYFSSWKVGKADEIGLMQITPTVAREWAKATGFQEFEKQAARDVGVFLSDPERNIQIGCWYLEKMRENYRDFPAEQAMMLAAYNAGASRVQQWSISPDQAAKMSEREFIENIDIPSTRAYVSSILERYREVKK